MIGDVRRRIIVLATTGYVGVHVLLGLDSIGTVTSPSPYLMAMALVVAASVAVFLPLPPRAARLLGPGVATAAIVAGLLVVSVLPDGRPGYALWYPSLAHIPLAGIALRGHTRDALAGAAASAATTLWWAASSSTVGLEDGLYRVVTPTATVVVAIGIATLVRQYAAEVDRSHHEQEAAARLSAAAEASHTERAHRLAEIEQVAAPLLRQLASGRPVDASTATECRLVEAALRDGIRGRGLVAGPVRETVWAARSRGVQVSLLDDAGTAPTAPEAAVAATLRECAVTLLELLEDGVATVRLAASDEGTIVVVDPRPVEVARTCARLLTSGRAQEAGEAPEVSVEAGEEEIVVRVQARTSAALTGTSAPQSGGAGSTASQATSNMP